MNANKREKHAYSEADIQSAITALRAGEYPSIRKCAEALHIPRPTLQHRLAGRISRSTAHEMQHILTKPEEKTLVRWITHLTNTGFPASPALVIQMAEEIRHNRYQISKTPPSYTKPIGKSWLDRFRNRHPEIKGVWARQLEGVRHKAMGIEAIKTWFEAVEELYLQHQYPPERIFNMDESGFAVGESQSSRVLVNVREQSSWKVVSGRQEWITAIECIGASGVAIPPLIIFKAKHTNTGWIPSTTPPRWRFSTSNSGWTSDSHAYEWLTTVFEPETRPDDPSLHRLLIMDGHGSHITANVIAHCMEHAIDLLILPPHTSHVLQPLDVSVFAPLKRALASETDAASRLDPGRVPRVEWTQMYIRAREKAITTANIKSGWKATGLQPLSAITVPDKLKQPTTSRHSEPRTPGQTSTLDLSLLTSSPPDGTELRRANQVFNTQICSVDNVPSPAKRYSQRMTQAVESLQSKVVTLEKRLAEQEELLGTRKTRKTGKRVALKGKFVFTTEEVLEIARQAEEEVEARKGRKRTRRPLISVQIPENKENILDYVYIDSESDPEIIE